METKQLRDMIEQQEKTLNDESVKAKERISAAEALADNLKTVQSKLEREKDELKQQLSDLLQKTHAEKQEMLR